MIIRPFNVTSQGQTVTLVDVLLFDSELKKRSVESQWAASLDAVQNGALCENRGLVDRGDIDNVTFGIEAPDNTLLGIWMLGCIQYVSGPWDDLRLWNRVSPGAPIMLSAVPMTGRIPSVTPLQEARFGRDVAAYLLDPASPLVTGQNRELHFDFLHYAIFLLPDDPIAMRAKLHHQAVVDDPRIDVTTEPHPTISGLTLVELRWAG